MTTRMTGTWLVIYPILAGIVSSLPVDEKCQSKRPLDEHIQHYEPVHYDLEEFGHRHRRALESSRRSTDPDEIAIKFHAHGRHFHLILKPDTSDLMSHTEFHIEGDNGLEPELDYNPSSFLKGYVADDEGSSIAAFSDNGVMSASIHCSHGSYFLKPAHQHFKESQPFHSLMFRSTDISPIPVSILKNETRRKEVENHHFCGHGKENGEGSKLDMFEEEQQQQERLVERMRSKRTTDGVRRSPKFVCTLAIHADYHFLKGRAGGDKNRAIAIMRQHVHRATEIISSTDFDQNGKADGFLFKIGRITVTTSSTAGPFPGEFRDYHRAGANGLDEAIHTDLQFLNIFAARPDNKDFCESMLFTYFDFAEGVLGLAFVTPGGICAKEDNFRTPFDHNGKRYTRHTPNVGFTTFINYGTQQNEGITEIVFAHEAGHNWGSPHDGKNGRKCTPGGADGNYLMYSKATDGTKVNNAKFSSCSKVDINRRLNTYLGGDCFSDDPNAFCGNGVVEIGEECDCGINECEDKCCNVYKMNDKDNNCKINKTLGYECSALKGECCNEQCMFVARTPGATLAPATTATPAADPANPAADPPASPDDAAGTVTPNSSTATTPPPAATAQVKCGAIGSCHMQAYCILNASCPTPIDKPNGVLCTPQGLPDNITLDFRQSCLKGHCSESACVAAGYQQCSCGQTSCQLCCTVNGVCVNTHTRPVIGKGLTLSKVYLAPGIPCNNYNGQCDLKGQCAAVDFESSLNGVNDLFSSATFNAIGQWLKNNWLYVLLMVIGLIGVGVAVHFTYKFKKTHSWAEGKQLAKSATMRVGKSLRGPKSTRGRNGGQTEKYDARTCARRMSKMFPRAGYEVVSQITHSCDNEESAVIQALDQGHKMCRW